jgi:protein gp37
MQNSHIGWTHHTHNHWIGCEHKLEENPGTGKLEVDPACANCYAKALMDDRYHRVKWGKGQERILTSEANRKKPFAWNRKCEQLGIRERVFSLSLGDWLDVAVPIEWLAELLHLTQQTPNLDWMLLTKRPELWRERLLEVALGDFPSSEMTQDWLNDLPPENIWIGITAGDQATADRRIPILKKIPVKVRFISHEPLVEPIDMHRHFDTFSSDEGTNGYCHNQSIHLGIIGGESGVGCGESHIEHLRSLMQQYQSAGINVFVKQLGSRPMLDGKPYPKQTKNGDTLEEMPADLRVQQIS